jgi:diacylglycerol O-acyltransferase
MERRKSDDQAGAFESLRSLSENLPAVFHALAGMNGVPSGQVNLVCTNVPGPLIPLYSCGKRMLAHYPMLPLTADMGLGVAITSYDKALYIGVMADPDIVPEVETIRRFIDEEFELLRNLADVPKSDLPDIGVKPQKNGHVPADLRTERAPASEPVASAAPSG